MTTDQIHILLVIVAMIGLFLWGRWRHDIVALAALLACVVLGLVPGDAAFAGFGHPAVITVACVLVLSGALQATGAVDLLTRHLLPRSAGTMGSIGAITCLAAVLSAFMNNVGALALLMPLGLQLAARLELPPGKVLMPLAFGSILGGMTTLIGTPPNLIVSGFRTEATGRSFAMFDFAPVGVPVALAGLAFLVLIGWRLVPTRQREGKDSFETGSYLTEARVPEQSIAAGKSLREIESELEAADAQVIGLVRNEVRIAAPSPFREVRAGDILIIEAEPESLATALSSLGLKLEEDRPQANDDAGADAGADDDDKATDDGADLESGASEPEPGASTLAADAGKDGGVGADGTEARSGGAVAALSDERAKADGTEGAAKSAGSDTSSKVATSAKVERSSVLQNKEVELMELTVRPYGNLIGRSASEIRMRSRYGINLLAISRAGRRSVARLRSVRITDGDVLLMQGPPEAIREFANRYGCVPLAERPVRVPDSAKAFNATVVMVAAIALAAFGLLPAAVAFAAGILAAVLLRVVPVRQLYDAIDWPVVVLLAALIPVAGAMASTGAAGFLAQSLMAALPGGSIVLAVTVILVLTMTLSDFMNNAATAAVMCPIAIGVGAQLGASPEPFLMAVAVGASCAFLTPIGHQNNTLILGPSGFQFGDYWKLGLLVEIVVVAVAVPMILLVWGP